MIKVGQGDTEPLRVELRNRRGKPSLVGATIVFKMRQIQGRKFVTGNCVVIGDPDDAIVDFEQSSSDFDPPGLYNATWTVTFPNGKTQTYPTESGPEQILVEPAVAP